MHNYLFTTIMPVYNVSKYLETSIKSIIKQSIGFKNIQLILINDGSTDNSEKICLKYKSKYPNNIVYIKQENKGVSAARNNGLEVSSGKYIHFLDSDDKMGKTAYKKVYEFFESHYDEVDVVSVREKYFEAKSDWHLNDYIFNEGTRVVDIISEYDKGIYSVCASFFKKEAISNIRFNTSLKYGEDTLFLNLVVLKKCKIGLIKEAIYYYRKRKDETSATQIKKGREIWYTDTVKYYYEYLLDYALNKYGNLLYIQYIIFNGMYNRLFISVPKEIDYQIFIKYVDSMISLLKKIDDKIILKYRSNKKIFLNKLFYVFKLKYGNSFYKKIVIEKNNVLLNDNKLCVSNRLSTYKTIYNKKNSIIEGTINSIIPNNMCSYTAIINDKRYDIDLIVIEGNKKSFNDECIDYNYEFNIDVKSIKKVKMKNIKILLTINDKEIEIKSN